jgi:hypothetical protein
MLFIPYSNDFLLQSRCRLGGGCKYGKIIELDARFENEIGIIVIR